MSRRALVIVLDSVGCGAAPDAASYGDTGADTLGHIRQQAGLNTPHLDKFGWSNLFDSTTPPEAELAVLLPQSAGKDTTTGHWELMGVVLEKPFRTFESFDPELVRQLEEHCGTQFIGLIAASGTEILEKMGPESVRTGLPILYTSADSVLQIAAHEEHFGLDRLLKICRKARGVADHWQIGRVIARPFIGDNGDWQRTSHRRDFSLLPPETVLNRLQQAGVETVGIGKISDIFAGSGVTRSLPTKSNAAGMKTIETAWSDAASSTQETFLLANLVDFDTLFGHRRDVTGYGKALEEFDEWLGDFVSQIAPNDMVIITADHGNDPTFPGTDHTREKVPAVVFHENKAGFLGEIEGFSWVAQQVEAFFNPAA